MAKKIQNFWLDWCYWGFRDHK